MVILQATAAGVLVLASALYAVWRLAPGRSRMRLLGWIAGAFGGSGKWVAKLRSEAAKEGAGACGSCGSGGIRSRPAARTRTPAAPRR